MFLPADTFFCLIKTLSLLVQDEDSCIPTPEVNPWPHHPDEATTLLHDPLVDGCNTFKMDLQAPMIFCNICNPP